MVHVTAHPRLRMNEFLSNLEYYGYDTPEINYDAWKTELDKFISPGVEKDQEQLALMPLYHFCMNDLPATTRAPELDDENAVKVLKADEIWTGVDDSAGSGVTREDTGRLLAYLSAVGFIGLPGKKGRQFPHIEPAVVKARIDSTIGGRGGVS